MNLLVEPERAAELARRTREWPSITLDALQVATLELLINGSLHPLTGYMTGADVEACDRSMHLQDGTFWPVPIVLTLSERSAAACTQGSPVVLRDAEGYALAVLHVADKRAQAAAPAPGLDSWQVGGRIEGLALPRHLDFPDLWSGPDATRNLLSAPGRRHVLAFQTERLIHRAEFEAIRERLESLDGGLLLQAVVSPIDPFDRRFYSRVRAYRAVVEEFGGRATLRLLPLSWAKGCQGEALRAIVARNYGCTHVVASPQLLDLLREHQIGPEELGIATVSLPQESAGPAEQDIAALLEAGTPLPEGFTFPAVAAELELLMPPRARRGLTVWFTGLSGSGKSTVANAVRARLLARGARTVTFLDGDLVRQYLSSELGFSREHRDLNVRRIGFVASEITRHGGIAMCAPISPYDATRRAVRREIEAVGNFVLVYVSTPLETCIERDAKGLYARAKAGLIKEFTGVSDPYEPPTDADVVLDTSAMTIDAAADAVINFLESAAYLRP